MADSGTIEAVKPKGYLGYAPIDCDIHPAVPDFRVLMPYLDDYWRETVLTRGIDRLNFDLTAYPPTAPLSVLRLDNPLVLLRRRRSPLFR